MLKIGKKNIDIFITNKIIWDIEEVFDKEISKVMGGISEMKTKDLALLIFQTVKDELTFDEFSEQIELNQYIPAATEVILKINKAFGVDEKKK